MIYVLAALLPPLGLLLNGQPFSAIFNLVLIVFCLVFGLIFHVLLLVPSAHALIAVHMKREDRRHREVVAAIRQHGPPGRIACKIGLTVQTVSTIIRELELQDSIIGAREVPKFRGYAATALPSPSLKRRSSNQLRNS